MLETMKKIFSPLKISGIRQRLSKAIVALVVGAILSLTMIPAGSTQAAVWNPSPNNPGSRISDTSRAAINFWRSHRWGPAVGWHDQVLTGRYWQPDMSSSRGTWVSYQSQVWRYHGGTYQDRDRQLRNWLQQNTTSSGLYTNTGYGPGYYGMWFREFDITAWANTRHPRDAYRIVREMRYGHTFVTFDHYSSFTYIGIT